MAELTVFDEWECLACDGELQFSTRAEAVAHIKAVHSGNNKGRKNMVLHLDFDRGQWESHYEWDFGDFKMLETTGQRRI